MLGSVLSKSVSPVRWIVRASVVAVLLLAALPAVAQNQLWIQQFGTDHADSATAAAPDGLGGVYSSGLTEGSLGGPATGFSDVWLARHDSAGNLLWIRQFGTSSFERPGDAAPDGSGGVYVGGGTTGDFGGPHVGQGDAWIARHDGTGNQLWIRHLGTVADESTSAVAPDGSSGVYVAGSTNGSLCGPSVGDNDGWIARYDSTGNQLWSRQFGSRAYDDLNGAAPDGSGGLYVVGRTYGSFGGPNAGKGDIWLARYDGLGNQVWVHQFGSSEWDYAEAAAPDGAGGVYISGDTRGELDGPNAGGSDAWVARYDNLGNRLWIRQLGTSDFDTAYTSAPDGSGNVYVGGITKGSLGGPSAGGYDVWLARYCSAGHLLWIRQLGTHDSDFVYAAAQDGSGGVYVGGSTGDSLGGPNAGSFDAWVARYDGGTPPTAYCTAKTSSAGCTPTLSGPVSASVSGGSASYDVTATPVPGVAGAVGMLLYHSTVLHGGTPNSPTLGSFGWLCVAPFKRSGVIAFPVPGSGGCASTYTWDFGPHTSTLTPGDTIWLQGWYRDSGSTAGANFTDGFGPVPVVP